MKIYKAKINAYLLNLALSPIEKLQPHGDCGPIWKSYSHRHPCPYTGDSLMQVPPDREN